MSSDTFYIPVYEHEWIRTDKVNIFGRILPTSCYDALCSYYGDKGVPYFTLIHNGIKFCEFVGVLRVGKYTIEVLPKADKSNRKGDEGIWQQVLVQMLKKSGNFPVDAPSSSNLRLQQNSILDLYIKLFLTQARKLVHDGLIKKYRKTEGNINVLKGRLLFNKQLQSNLIHGERFYTAYTTYSSDNIYNQIIFKVLELIPKISSFENASLAKELQLNFPEMGTLRVDENTFQKLKIDRKTERYQSLISIAKLLLLNYHPDVKSGQNHVLALMFDMNKLWEKYVLTSLKKASYGHDTVVISGQESTEFWNGRRLRPDIIIRTKSNTYVIDTKWKALEKPEPSMDDVRQMYSYNYYFDSTRSILLYPNVYNIAGIYSDYKLPKSILPEEIHGCGIYFVDVVNQENCLNLNLGSELLTKIIQ